MDDLRSNHFVFYIRDDKRCDKKPDKTPFFVLPLFFVTMTDTFDLTLH